MADTGIAGWIETHPALSIGAVVVGGLLLVGIAQSKKQAPAATTPAPTQATGDLSGLQTDANGNPILYRVASDTYINTSIFEDSYNSSVDSHNQSNSNNTTTTTVNPPPPDTPPPPPPTPPPPSNTNSNLGTWSLIPAPGGDFLGSSMVWHNSLLPMWTGFLEADSYTLDSNGVLRQRYSGAPVSPTGGAMANTDWSTPDASWWLAKG